MKKSTTENNEEKKELLNEKKNVWEVTRGMQEMWLNKYQIEHTRGIIDVYRPIVQANGSPSLPSLADQWKFDFKKRYNARTRNR
jgi:hypothetical protein